MDTEQGERDRQKRHRDLLRAMERHLTRTNDGAGVDDLAGQACLSRYHFQRVFRSTVGEPPGTVRRRLRLERAAWDLRTTDAGIIEIALDAGYRSHEGFSRAFRAAYGLSPTKYRRAARRIRLLPGASGVHYDPQTQTMRIDLPGGRPKMDLMDRLIESDYMTKRRILECARLLSDRQLDAPLTFRHNLMPFVEPARTLRESLAYMIYIDWVDLMFDRTGWKPDDDSYRQIEGNTPDAMIQRFEGYHAAYRAFVQKVRRENLWDQEWIDDSCTQPETFAIGSVIEAQLTWDIAYRSVLERQMEQMGFQLRDLAIPEIKGHRI